MSRIQIFVVGAHGKSIVKGSQDVNGALFGAPREQHVSLILSVSALNPEHWNIIPVGGSKDLFYIQHDDTGVWAFAPENPQENNFVLATADTNARAEWRIKTHLGDEKTIHLKDNERLIWGVETADEESEVKLKVGESNELNRWRFGRVQR